MKKLPLSKWTFKDFVKYIETKKYKSSGQIKIKDNRVYIAASKKKIIPQIRTHFGWNKEVIVFYTLAESLKMAKKFKNVDSWKKSEHFKKTKKKNFVLGVMNWSLAYTYDSCLDSAKHCKTIAQWRLKKRRFHDAAVTYGWDKKIFKKKGWIVKKKQTSVALIIAAFNSKSMTELKAKNESAYNRIKENGWQKDIFEKTKLIKAEIKKSGVVPANKVTQNIFPITERLKKKLTEDFWLKAA